MTAKENAGEGNCQRDCWDWIGRGGVRKGGGRGPIKLSKGKESVS